MTSVRRRPAFLDTPRGALFALDYAPTEARPSRAVVLVPPFGEEMNRARRMFTLQAEQLACAGLRAIVFDFFGCGDSSGDLADATVDDWDADLQVVTRWARTSGTRQISLLGARFGALLAARAAGRSEDYDRLALWQPVSSGGQVVTQFLRLQMAAGMTAAGNARDDTRQRLDAGETVEIAGYPLSAAMVQSLEALSVEAELTNVHTPLGWFEVVGTAGQAPTAVARKWLEMRRSRSNSGDVTTVVGEPFWTTVEIAVVPQLLERTTAFFATGISDV